MSSKAELSILAEELVDFVILTTPTSILPSTTLPISAKITLVLAAVPHTLGTVQVLL